MFWSNRNISNATLLGTDTLLCWSNRALKKVGPRGVWYLTHDTVVVVSILPTFGWRTCMPCTSAGLRLNVRLRLAHPPATRNYCDVHNSKRASLFLASRSFSAPCTQQVLLLLLLYGHPYSCGETRNIPLLILYHIFFSHQTKDQQREGRANRSGWHPLAVWVVFHERPLPCHGLKVPRVAHNPRGRCSRRRRPHPPHPVPPPRPRDSSELRPSSVQ